MEEPLFEGVLTGRAKLREVALKKSGQLGGDRNLLRGTCELFEDVLQSSPVVDEEKRMSHREGVAGGLRGDEGIAVAVATDP